jgi:flagellar basal body-associated protein FliL
MDNEQITMSRIAFERMQAKDERNDRWRNIIIIILIVLLALTNGAWLYAWNQYDYSSSETHQVDVKADGNSNANYVGGNGEINNGSKDNSNDNKDENEKKEERSEQGDEA